MLSPDTIIFKRKGITLKQLEEAIASSKTFTEASKKIKLKSKTGLYDAIRKHKLEHLVAHFPKRGEYKYSGTDSIFNNKYVPLSAFLEAAEEATCYTQLAKALNISYDALRGAIKRKKLEKHVAHFSTKNNKGGKGDRKVIVPCWNDACTNQVEFTMPEDDDEFDSRRLCRTCKTRDAMTIGMIAEASKGNAWTDFSFDETHAGLHTSEGVVLTGEAFRKAAQEIESSYN